MRTLILRWACTILYKRYMKLLYDNWGKGLNTNDKAKVRYLSEAYEYLKNYLRLK